MSPSSVDGQPDCEVGASWRAKPGARHSGRFPEPELVERIFTDRLGLFGSRRVSLGAL